MDNPDWHAWLQAGVLDHIRIKARHLARTGSVPGVDHSDLEQEFLLDLWRRRGAFNPARSPFGAFARMVVTHRAASLAAPTARHLGERRAMSLDAAMPGNDGDGDATLADILSADISPFDREAALAIQLDVHAFVASLTPAMQRCCAAIAHGSVADAADAEGLHRSLVYETLGRIRRRAVAAGLDVHLGAPDNSAASPVLKADTAADHDDERHTAVRGFPRPDPARRTVGPVAPQPRKVAVEVPRTLLGEDREQGQVQRAGRRGVRGGESARPRGRRDSAAAASMSDPELNPQFRRRWTEPDRPPPRREDAGQHKRGQHDALAETGRGLRDEWRRGRTVRGGGVR